MVARENSSSPPRQVALGTGHSNHGVNSGTDTPMVPQGSPVGKEFAVAVGRTLVVVELAVGLETFVERCLEAAPGPGVEHALG